MSTYLRVRSFSIPTDCLVTAQAPRKSYRLAVRQQQGRDEAGKASALANLELLVQGAARCVSGWLLRRLWAFVCADAVVDHRL